MPRFSRVEFCKQIQAICRDQKVPFSSYFAANFHKGSFNNYVDKRRWVGGQLNVYVCLRGVGTWSVKCLRRQKSKYLGRLSKLMMIQSRVRPERNYVEKILSKLS